ncbi:DUF4136 domain-containing protein [uncultured Erythrobacter sp.]|uniref:DUF4136 domain-containing protein n=1 Tax=uncultured Erythrobacter sp. TaxID=263913 RepID=UPI00261E89CE|nr:DUF4136 domain-containing protein [uncultured Erythrobacter sp.]
MKTMSIFIAGTALALSACATTGNITTDFDQAQDFSSYKTFAWASERPMLAFGDRLIPAAIQSEVADSIKEDFAAKGYSFTEDLAAADFAVSFTIGTRDSIEFREPLGAFWENSASWRWGGRFWPSVSTPTISRMEFREYTEGTLSVDVYDVSRKSPVWHGVGSRNLSRSEIRGRTNTAAEDVKTILAGFPPS